MLQGHRTAQRTKEFKSNQVSDSRNFDEGSFISGHIESHLYAVLVNMF